MAFSCIRRFAGTGAEARADLSSRTEYRQETMGAGNRAVELATLECCRAIETKYFDRNGFGRSISCFSTDYEVAR